MKPYDDAAKEAQSMMLASGRDRAEERARGMVNMWDYHPKSPDRHNMESHWRRVLKYIRWIRTDFDRKPIPARDRDWSAITGDYDGAEDAGPQFIGYGETEHDALADLFEQLNERE